MIRRKDEVRQEPKERIRGGVGRALQREVLSPGEMAGIEIVSTITLEAGASVGEHRHQGSEELYLVLEGTGTAILDGGRFMVGPGDAFLAKDGHSHGLENGPNSLLVFLAVLVRVKGA